MTKIFLLSAVAGAGFAAGIVTLFALADFSASIGRFIKTVASNAHREYLIRRIRRLDAKQKARFHQGGR